MEVLMDGRALRRDLGFAVNLLRRRPFQCLLQVTNRCNMKCSFCDFWPNGAPAHEELTLDELRGLAAELAGLGRFLVSIEGGEPFVRPDLAEIVRAFADHHLPLLFTNGWYVDDASARRLFAAGLVQVGVSIDYPDPDRHDRQRGLAGAFARAWRAVDAFREAAPHGGRQVHVMTVLMEDNWRDLATLLEMSAARGVGHSLTLLATSGFRRAPGRAVPAAPVADALLALWRQHPHLRAFREYLARMDAFLAGGSMPRCRAGVQSFNVDHVGNVAACIEKIDRVAGNIRQEPLARIHARLMERDDAAGCQACWTACRGFTQVLGGGGTLGSWRELAGRMRSA
jgi:MoaA/NifB/PqqE/SkfB family radical SAM enzyme